MRKPARCTEPWLNAWMTTSSSSAMVVSQILTRPSVEPDRRRDGFVGWKFSYSMELKFWLGLDLDLDLDLGNRGKAREVR